MSGRNIHCLDEVSDQTLFRHTANLHKEIAAKNGCQYRNLSPDEKFVVDQMSNYFKIVSDGPDDMKVYAINEICTLNVEDLRTTRRPFFSDFVETFGYLYGPQVQEVVYATMELVAFIPPMGFLMTLHKPNNTGAEAKILDHFSFSLKEHGIQLFDQAGVTPGLQVVIPCSNGNFMRAIILGGEEEEVESCRLVMCDTVRASTCSRPWKDLLECPDEFLLHKKVGNLMLFGLNGVSSIREDLNCFLKNLAGNQPLSCVLYRKHENNFPVIDILCEERGHSNIFLSTILLREDFAKADDVYKINNYYSEKDCLDENGVKPLPFFELYTSEQMRQARKPNYQCFHNKQVSQAHTPSAVFKSYYSGSENSGRPDAEKRFLAHSTTQEQPYVIPTKEIVKIPATQPFQRPITKDSSSDDGWGSPQKIIDHRKEPVNVHHNSAKIAFEDSSDEEWGAPKKSSSVSQENKKMSPNGHATVSDTSSKRQEVYPSNDWGAPTPSTKQPDPIESGLVSKIAQVSLNGKLQEAPNPSKIIFDNSSDEEWGVKKNTPAQEISQTPTESCVTVSQTDIESGKNVQNIDVQKQSVQHSEHVVAVADITAEPSATNLSINSDWSDEQKLVEKNQHIAESQTTDRNQSWGLSPIKKEIPILSCVELSPSEPPANQVEDHPIEKTKYCILELATALCDNGEINSFIQLCEMSLKMSSNNAGLVNELITISEKLIGRDVVTVIADKVSIMLSTSSF